MQSSLPNWIPLLLSAVVVFCPLRCTFGGCEANVDGNVPECCGCCKTFPGEAAIPSPVAPSNPDDCKCTDCFCDGALIEGECGLGKVAPGEFSELLDRRSTIADRRIPDQQVLRNLPFVSIDASALQVRAWLGSWTI